MVSLAAIENFLLQIAEEVPLEIFTFFGVILEEVIAPIPAPFVTTTAGTIALAQHKPLIFLLWLSLIATAGKTIGSYFFYVLADKAEDYLLTRFGKFIGVTHKEVESIGKHFNGTIADDITLTILRAIPVVPSTPISIVCGFIKLNMRTFIVSTVVGGFIRNLIFLIIGYQGLHAITNGFDSWEAVIKIILVMGIVTILLYLYYKRSKENLLGKILAKIKGSANK